MGSLWKFHLEFVASGGNIKNAMKFNNVVNKPLIKGDYSTKITSLINFPELQVLTGVVGKVVKELERKAFTTAKEGTDFMNKWMETVNVQRTVYHGSASFVGDMAARLLKNTDSLDEAVKEQLDIETASKVAPFVDVLRKLNVVKQVTFGQQLVPGYEGKVKEFSAAYRGLDITVPLKVNQKFKKF